MDYREEAIKLIQARNVIRREVDLPLLNSDSDVEKHIEWFKEREYRQFYTANREKAEGIVLKEIQETDPNFQVDASMKSVKVGTMVRNLIKQWWNEQNNAS